MKKLSAIIGTFANMATIVIAACAVFGIWQTAKSLRETANINKMAAQYYSTQNALTRPIFRIEQTPSHDFSNFKRDGWTLPFGPEDICKDINVYNDGSWVKSVDVTIQTYLMTCYYTLTTSNSFQGVAMFVPVKDFYSFAPSGKVRGLIAKGRTSKFQKKLMAQIRDSHSGANGKHIAVCYPFNVYTIEYEDALGNRHKEMYSIDMEISGKERELEHDLIYSTELFKGRVFNIDDFDINKIVKEYGAKAAELGNRYAEKGFIRGIHQDARPIVKEK